MKPVILLLSMAVAAMGQPMPAAGNVSLPLEEYNKLVEQAAKAGAKPGLPQPYALRSANLNFEIKADSVSGIVQLDGEVLADGTIKVPLAKGLTVMDARRQGKDLPLTLEGGVHTAILQGPGEFSVTLDAGLPLRFDTGRAQFQMPPFEAGSPMEGARPGPRKISSKTAGNQGSFASKKSLA